MNDDSGPTIVPGRHAYGRFDRRYPIGPVRWPFFDLLWIHSGSVELRFGGGGQILTLGAPNGVLILPGTAFFGAACGAFASASVCHFELKAPIDGLPEGPGHMVPSPGERHNLHNLVRVAMNLAEHAPDALARRSRLLRVIIDGFVAAASPALPTAMARDDARLAAAWEAAARDLHAMRGLADVAALIGVRESTLRALHRRHGRGSAGSYLRELRLTRAEALLSTTGYSLAEIASQVGYGHAETLAAAFRRSRGMTPGAFRRSAHPFA